MLPVTFRMSAEAFKQAKQGLYIAPITALVLPLFRIFTPSGVDMSWSSTFIMSAILFVLMFLFAHFWGPHFIKQQSKALEVTLKEVGILRNNRGNIEILSYEQIRHLIIQQSRDGDVIGFKVKLPKQTVFISRLEKMALMEEILLNQLPSSTKVEKKTVWLNSGNLLATTVYLIFIVPIAFILTQTKMEAFMETLFLLSLVAAVTLWGAKRVSERVKQHILLQGQTYNRNLFIIILWSWIMSQSSGGFFSIVTAPCGLIGRVVQQSGCVRSFEGGNDVAFLTDNETIVYNDSSSLVLAPISGWSNYWTPTLPHERRVEEYWVPENGRILLSKTTNDRHIDELRIWDVENQQLQQTVTKSIGFVSLSANGQKLAFANLTEEHGVTEFWQIQPWQKVGELSGDVKAISPEFNSLVKYENDQIVVQEIPSGETVKILEQPDELRNFPLNEWGFSPDGQKLFVASQIDKIIGVWEMPNGNLLYYWHIEEGLDKDVIAFSPDSQFLIASIRDEDGYARLAIWNLATGIIHKEIALGKHPYSIDFSADGSLMAVGASRKVFIFDVAKMLE